MTSWLESPVPALMVGGLTTALFAGGWMKTGHRWMLLLAVAALGITIGLVLLERYVVTERERVENTVLAIAERVQANDVPGLLEYIHADATNVRTRASQEMGRYRFSRVVVKNNLRVEMNSPTADQAVAHFNVVVVLGDAGGTVTDQHIARTVQLTFARQGSEWRLWNYAHTNVLGNPDQFSEAFGP
jgi:hypothetical protein